MVEIKKGRNIWQLLHVFFAYVSNSTFGRLPFGSITILNLNMFFLHIICHHLYYMNHNFDTRLRVSFSVMKFYFQQNAQISSSLLLCFLFFLCFVTFCYISSSFLKDRSKSGIVFNRKACYIIVLAKLSSCKAHIRICLIV